MIRPPWLSDIRLVSFDLDDTLWPIQPVINRAEDEMWQLIVARYPAVKRRFDREGLKALRVQIGEAHPEHAHDLTELRTLTYRAMLERCGYDAADAEALTEHFLGWRHQVRLYEDAERCLAQLAAHYPLATLSNGNACVDRIGLGRHFRHRLSARSVGIAKPAPAIFGHLIDQSGLAPTQILHVGDHWHDDVQGALGAGLYAAWLSRDRQWRDLPPQALVVHTLDDLTHLLTPSDP